MFFGLEMSHAPPQNLFERKTGKAPAIPTVVGVRILSFLKFLNFSNRVELANCKVKFK